MLNKVETYKPRESQQKAQETCLEVSKEMTRVGMKDHGVLFCPIRVEHIWDRIRVLVRKVIPHDQRKQPPTIIFGSRTTTYTSNDYPIVAKIRETSLSQSFMYVLVIECTYDRVWIFITIHIDSHRLIRFVLQYN